MATSVQSLTDAVLENAARAQDWTWLDSWDEDRLIPLVRTLAAAGLQADAALLAGRLRDRLGADRAHVISEARLAVLNGQLANQPLPEAMRRLRTIIAFAIDAGLDDPSPVLEAIGSEGRPQAAMAACLGCEWYARLGRHADAAAAYESVDTIDFPGFPTMEAYHRALVGEGRILDAETLLVNLATQHDCRGMTPVLALNCARALTLRGCNARAAEVLELLQREEFGDPSRPTPPNIRQRATMELAALEQIAGGAAPALAVVQRQLQLTPGNLTLEARRIGLMFRISGEDAAVDAARIAIRANPLSAEILLAIHNLPFSQKSVRGLLDERMESAAGAPIPPGLADVLLRMALEADRMDEARALASGMGESSRTARLVLSGRLQPSHRLRSDIRETGFHVAKGDRAGPVLIVFPAFKNRMLGVPLHLFDSFPARYGITTIYAFDHANSLFLFGAEGVAPDLGGVISHIAQLPEVAKARARLCFGGSGGGFPALRAALEMKADACMTYGAKTIIGRPAEKVPDPRLEMLARHVAMLPARDRDLRAVWPESQHLRARLYYGADYAPDKAHAERLADRPGVELCPVPGIRAAA